MSSFANQIKSFDVYRKLPSDLTQSTSSGALVSILATLVMLGLFITEIQGYIAVEEGSQMFVDVQRGEDQIKVNFQIQYYRHPCDILSIAAQDVMGSAINGFEGHLEKWRTDTSGYQFQKFKLQNDDPEGSRHYIQDLSSRTNMEIENLDYQRVARAFRDEEGCFIKGFIFVHRVPGFIVFTSKQFGRALYRVFSDSRIQNFDMSHKIHQFSFGEQVNNVEIKKKFTGGVQNPLQGVDHKSQTKSNSSLATMYLYYLSVIPTTYVELNGKESFLYQFTSIANQIQTNDQPGTYLRFDLSPITVKYYLEREPFLHFIVQICAIIGGVFTFAKVIDSVIYQSIVAMLKKSETGRLS